MGEVGKDERYPRKEEIPDQPEMPARFAVCYAGEYEPDAHGASNVEQRKDREVMTVSENEITKSIAHDLFVFDQIPDQVNVAGGAPIAGEDRRRFGLVLRAVIDEMSHGLP